MEEELNVSELAGLLGDDELLDVTSPLVAALPQSATSAELDGKDVGSKKKHKRKGKRLRHEKKHRKLSEIEENNESEDDNNETPRKRSKYVIDAAESGDSESEGDDFIVGSDEEDEDGDYVGGIPTYEPRKTHIFREGEENMTSEELARAIEERHRASKEGGKTETSLLAGLGKGNMSSLRYTSHLLPQDTDPRVFAVKCRPRMARLLVARIVNKCYAYRIGRNYEKRKVDLGIISVFCLDHVKEYIYIEAHRKVFVENALKGLDGLFRYKITLVNPSELMQMMERRPSPEKLRVGSFVRLRQRQYRLDLAQVVEVHPISNQVTVKVVPREDFVGKPFNKIEMRLPPRFLFQLLQRMCRSGAISTAGEI
ncbi:putative transcription initiation protein [Trypanosoma cruzi]|uniref:Putative transcription initiation protein n=1 Tax=Trypanosoma cruzi TaxID=5693 RepID=A0A2V2VTI0_TRYCR|nr:putative transcription initiation protein [Trypanosoma cruzi]